MKYIPINPAAVDSVTHKDQDHRDLWKTTGDNMDYLNGQVTSQQTTVEAQQAVITSQQKTIASHTSSITALQALVRNLQGQITALQAKV